ncbi:MAG: M20/M25/M40 family metallo-hydrolase [Acidobacteriales bacterium]|nr:M20/M25/M40 family metallo-hydrolase [Terriglobales bacterium]
MELVALTRELIDIESVTGHERAVGEFLEARLRGLGLEVSRMQVEPNRFNIYATCDKTRHPEIVLSTHMDTVPPFFASSEDATRIYGRGACDAKGIIAAQIAAAQRLRDEGIHVGLLFLVGEERDSLGAKVANGHPQGSRFLINGEPTDSRIALASKGTLRVTLTAHGKMAHSAYPELGESAIEKLVRALGKLLDLELPRDPVLGPCTMNIGLIDGGRATNVIPDHAQAQLLFRLIGPSDELRKQIEHAVAHLGTVEYTLEIPLVRLRSIPDLPPMVAAFTTDIPALTAWGEPLLIGPGSIHVAHTEGEYIEKEELKNAVDLYCAIVRRLLAKPIDSLHGLQH